MQALLTETYSLTWSKFRPARRAIESAAQLVADFTEAIADFNRTGLLYNELTLLQVPSRTETVVNLHLNSSVARNANGMEAPGMPHRFPVVTGQVTIEGRDEYAMLLLRCDGMGTEAGFLAGADGMTGDVTIDRRPQRHDLRGKRVQMLDGKMPDILAHLYAYNF